MGGTSSRKGSFGIETRKRRYFLETKGVLKQSLGNTGCSNFENKGPVFSKATWVCSMYDRQKMISRHVNYIAVREWGKLLKSSQIRPTNNSFLTRPTKLKIAPCCWKFRMLFNDIQQYYGCISRNGPYSRTIEVQVATPPNPACKTCFRWHSLQRHTPWLHAQ